MANDERTEAYSPGELIREELEARGWSQEDLAQIMGTSQPLVSDVMNGKRSITRNTALGLAAAFGTSAELWLNLDAQYRLSTAKPRKGAAHAALRSKLYAKAPVRAMLKRGWIKERPSIEEMEREVLAFAGQDALDAEWVFEHAARKSSDTYGITTPEQFAWLCRARQLAQLVVPHGPWRSARIKDLVAELRRLTLSPPALAELPRVLSNFGIRLVVVERLPGMRMDGATFWLDSEPVIALALRFDRIDNVWHTVMHEVAHIAHKDRLAVDEDILGRGEKPEGERRADEFAVSALVPQDKLRDFVSRVYPLFSAVRIVGFSNLHGVHPGIVVGQLHHRGPENQGMDYKYFQKLLVPVRSYITKSALTDGWGKEVPLESQTKS